MNWEVENHGLHTCSWMHHASCSTKCKVLLLCVWQWSTNRNIGPFLQNMPKLNLLPDQKKLSYCRWKQVTFPTPLGVVAVSIVTTQEIWEQSKFLRTRELGENYWNLWIKIETFSCKIQLLGSTEIYISLKNSWLFWQLFYGCLMNSKRNTLFLSQLSKLSIFDTTVYF